MMYKNKQPKILSLANTKQQPKHQTNEKETSSGGVVFRREGKNVFIALMKDSYGKWTFPKGHVEKGESVEEAAARETLEELGLNEICFWDELGKISIWFRDQFQKKGHLIHKDIHYFLFETRNTHLQHDESQHSYATKWVSLRALANATGYDDLKPIVIRAIKVLQSE